MKSLVKMKGYEVWNLHGNCEEQLLEKPGWLTGYNNTRIPMGQQVYLKLSAKKFFKGVVLHNYSLLDAPFVFF